MKTISGIEFASEHNGTDVFRVIELAYEQGWKDGHSEQLGTNLAEVGTNCISRQAAIDLWEKYHPTIAVDAMQYDAELRQLPSAQPEIIRCKDCIYYDPPHVENNGVRYEYDEMPADAFDALGTGLVSAEYGINIGGRCCVDYYCKNYSDDKRVFVREDNYCGRAERRTDD